MSESTNGRSRRPRGTGTVFQRKDGRWCAQFKAKDRFGASKTRTLYARTEKEALAKLHNALPARDKETSQELGTSRPSERAKAIASVYVVQCEHGGPIKIGLADNVDARVSDLRHYCPYPLRILHVLQNAGADTERRLHRQLGMYRLHGEWFEDHPQVHYKIAKMKKFLRHEKQEEEEILLAESIFEFAKGYSSEEMREVGQRLIKYAEEDRVAGGAETFGS